MLNLAANLMALVGLVGIFYLTGWLVDRTLIHSYRLQSMAAAVWFGFGAAVWMGLIFLLSALQILSRSTVGLTLLLMLVAIWRVRRATSTGFLPSTSKSSERDLAGMLLAIGVGVVLVTLWLQNQWPTIAWDADAYHLTVPRLYIENGGFRRLPFNVYSNWPLNTQMLYVLALLSRGYTLAKLVHFAFGVATLFLIYRVVRTSSRAWVGWVAAALFLLNPVVLDEMRAAYVDLAYGFFLFLAFLFLHRALSETDGQTQDLLLAGVLGGVAAGIKPTGILGALCLAILYLVVTTRRKDDSRVVLGGVLRLVLPVGLLLIPWALKSWILTGNPAYPFFYGIFGGPEWSTELGNQLGQWQQGMGMGRGWLDYLLLPVRVVLFGDRGYENFDGSILRLWIFLVPLAFFLRRRRPLIGRCLGFAGLYFVSWAVASQQMRFLIPALPFLAVATSLAIYESVSLLPAAIRPFGRWATSLTLLAMLTVTVSGLVPQAWHLVGQYLHLGAEVQAAVVDPVFQYIDDELPADAKLMLLNTNHGFFCHRDFVADSFFEASQINALFLGADGKMGIDRLLTDLGITHLLIENRDRYVPWPTSLFEFLNDPGLVRRVYRSPEKIYDVVEILGAERSGAN